MVVAGDLIPRAERGVRWLQERVPDRPVIYVMGNHEAYGTDEARTVEKAMETAEGTNIVVLQNRSLRIGDVIFAGATLWTDFELYNDQHRAMFVAGEKMNDYRKIRTARYRFRFRPPHALARHQQSRAFLESEMQKRRGDERLVIITHHAPIPDPAFRQPSHDSGVHPSDDEILTAAYRSDLTSLMWPMHAADGKNAVRPADLWIHGHTHESEDITIGHTRIVSNPKGYGPWMPRERSWDNSHFDPQLVIEI